MNGSPCYNVSYYNYKVSVSMHNSTLMMLHTAIWYIVYLSSC